MARKPYQLPAGTRFLTPAELAARRSKPTPGKTYGPALTGSLDADLFGPSRPARARRVARRRGGGLLRAVARARVKLRPPKGIWRRP